MVLSATIRNEKGEILGTFALTEWPKNSLMSPWFGMAKVALNGRPYWAACQLIEIDALEDEGAARPSDDP